MTALRPLAVAVAVVATLWAPTASAAPAVQRPVNCSGVTLKSPTVRLGKVVAVARSGKDICRRQAKGVVREFFLRRPKGLVKRMSVRGWKCAGTPGLVACEQGRGRDRSRLLAKWTPRASTPGGGGGGPGSDEALGDEAQSDPAAGDYYDGPGRWYSDTVRYYDATTNLQGGVQKAAEAWNASGARIRWVAVPRADARVVITEEVPDGGSGAVGTGTFPLQGQRINEGEIKLSPELADYRGYGQSPAVIAQVLIEVAVHEMGHVMGLDHQGGVCATMNLAVWQYCELDSVPYGQYRCRAPGPPDVARLVEIYGGVAAEPGPELCRDPSTPPPPPGATDVTVGEAPDPSLLRIAWTTPGDPAVQGLRLLYKREACPTSVNDPNAFNVGQHYYPAEAGRQTVDFPAESGRYCFAVYTTGEDGQTGPAATVFYEYTAPSPPPE